jgi:hypothetical protein
VPSYFTEEEATPYPERLTSSFAVLSLDEKQNDVRPTAERKQNHLLSTCKSCPVLTKNHFVAELFVVAGLFHPTPSPVPPM